ncbi:MAG: M48 family metalloprotease [Candidatus Schekmanbacteria bacterium]|nr:M48 family metalloprotease [Candidatus Schekmanbacteria bacterium]
MIEFVERKCSACQTLNRLTAEQLLQSARPPRCGRCKEGLFRAFEKPLYKIDPNHYIHPLDRKLLDAIHRVPGVRSVLRRAMAESVEKAWRLFHHANFVLVTNRQVASLRRQYEAAGAMLGVDSLPTLYVYQDPVPQAYTYGVEQPIIAVSSGLLELMDEREQFAILAHELGHWQCNHVLYKTAARLLGQITGIAAGMTLGLGALALIPIRLALLRWDRASELTADRAALLATREPEVVLRALMKIAGGSNKIYREMDFHAFLSQAEEFGQMREGDVLAKFIVGWDVLFRSHPYPIWRAQEIVQWVLEGDYLNILDGEYPTTSPVLAERCTECGRPTVVTEPICRACLAKEEERTGEDAAGTSDKASDEPPGSASERVSRALDDAWQWIRGQF